MSERKKVLLIAGGGTLGTYTARELLEKGHSVDVICLEDKVSCHPNLTFIKADADLQFLESYLENKYYDGIVNFLHTLGQYPGEDVDFMDAAEESMTNPDRPAQ